MNPNTKLQNNKPVIIVGAGLAGIACAHTLQKHGIKFLLLEQSSQVGGKLKSTTTSEGFLLDHGFQVLLTSYPELDLILDLKKLNLQTFNSGSLIYTPEKNKLLANPLVHPLQLLTSAFSSLATMKDKLLILKLIVICRIAAPSGIKNTSTIDYLNQFGFSARFIKLFWEPFLTGILLDPALKIDAEFFIFLVKAFSSGRAGVPSLGMQEIPRQIAVGLNADSIRLNVPVKELANNYVVLNTLEKIDAKNVVVAYNQSLDADSYRSVQNFYFTTSEPLEWGRWLVLVPPEYGFNILTVAVMNQVAPAYGNKSMESLLSVSVVKTKDITPEKLKLELRKIARKPLNDLKFIKSFAIPNALPKMNRLKCSNFDVVNGVYYCGDYASGPSINGALKSGRLVGESIARNFTE